MEIFNLFTGAPDDFSAEETPDGFRCSAVTIGPKIGAKRLGMTVYELPVGQAVCPYHFEWTDEEWLVVISGTPTLRTPEGERTLEAGDVVCFPDGPAGAHSFRNDTDENVRVLFLSTKTPVAMVRFPDSAKSLAWTRDEGAEVYRETLDYYDGE